MDLLVSLVAVFVAVAIGLSAAAPRPGYVDGRITNGGTGQGVPGCVIILAGGPHDTSAVSGAFLLTVDSLRTPQRSTLNVECAGFDPDDSLITLWPDSTVTVDFPVRRTGRTISRSLPGDALFDKGSYTLRPEGIDSVRALGVRLRAELDSTQVIGVQGHTDEQPFAFGSERDNWMLSGERAAAAARILTDSVGISRCQVVVMGFGPSRPRESLGSSDPPPELQRKRAANRRIDFVLLSGGQLSPHPCHVPSQ